MKTDIDEIAIEVRQQTKRTDLPVDVIRTLSRAFYAIGQLERERDESKTRLAIADEILGSEGFLWLIVGANHPDTHIDSLRPAFDAWKKAGGKPYGKS